jgi:NAD(P)-dependent dehydrogenase (short-subunit alcohol dehydrogenase family)
VYDGRYRDRLAVVTGAERLEVLSAALRALSPASQTMVCDVADTEALRVALARVVEAHGPVDLLINNAAQDPGVRLTDITEEDFRHTFDVNFFAPVAATLAVLPSMVQRGTGTVVNISSDGGRLPSPGPGAYPSSKAALSAFSESTSFRLGPKGIHVHVVYPAFMATALGVGALRRGLRPPPRLTIRTVESVSQTILARMGESSLDISVSRLIDAAMVFRHVVPRLYHWGRKGW